MTAVATGAATALEEFIERQRQAFGVPGAAVVVLQGDEPILERGFGLRDRERDLEVTAGTIFPIGSCTKAFTATLLATLVDEGRLEWDRPLRHYLPGFRMADPAATENLTPRDLLCHRSGLPRHELLWYNNTSLSKADVVERLQHLPANAGFREAWQYNNLMYLTAGYLAETLLGQPWEEAVRERILDPLGMTRTSFTVEAAQADPDHSRPYGRSRGEVREVPYRGLDLAGPAGSVNSCVAELSAWLRLQLDGGRAGDGRLLSDAALTAVHAPTMVMPGGEQFAEVLNFAYGLGWVVGTYRGRRLLWHTGGIDGFTALVAVVPGARIAFAVLTNLFGSPLVNVVGYRVLDELLELEPLPWDRRLRELQEAGEQGHREAGEHRRGTAHGTPPSHPLEDYAGVYVHPGYGAVEVTAAEGRLGFRYHGLDYSVTHLHYDVWEAQLPTFEDWPAVLLRFRTDFEGRIDALSAAMEPAVPPLEFARRPDETLSDPARLARLGGAYELGPLKLEVTADGQRLRAAIAGQGQVTLLPVQGWSFRAAEQAGLTFEFEVPDAGPAERVVVQPAGIFTRVSPPG